MHSFCSQVIKDHYKPLETFVLYMNYLLVAHGNIVSYYDTAAKDWMGHINFCDKESHSESGHSMVLNDTHHFMRNKKVLKVFRHEASKGEFNIGVLFRDGTFELLILKKNDKNKTIWVRKEFKGQINGNIRKICCDLEHYRILFIMTILDEKPLLYGFTEG